MNTLTYYIDFKSPAAYLSVNPTLKLADKLSTTVQILPYNTLQRGLPARGAHETKGETHIRVRETARRQTHLLYASLHQLDMTFPSEPGETRMALAALLFVRQNPLRFVHAAFHAYWVEHANLNDEATVRHLLDRSGYNSEHFDANELLHQLTEHQVAVEEQGVIDVPCYIVADQVFIGREHLPWIELLLTDTTTV